PSLPVGAPTDRFSRGEECALLRRVAKRVVHSTAMRGRLGNAARIAGHHRAGRLVAPPSVTLRAKCVSRGQPSLRAARFWWRVEGTEGSPWTLSRLVRASPPSCVA